MHPDLQRSEANRPTRPRIPPSNDSLMRDIQLLQLWCSVVCVQSVCRVWTHEAYLGTYSWSVASELPDDQRSLASALITTQHEIYCRNRASGKIPAHSLQLSINRLQCLQSHGYCKLFAYTYYYWILVTVNLAGLGLLEGLYIFW